MKLVLFDYLNFFLFVVGILALVRWNTVEKRFFPFLLFILIGCVNEALSYVLVANGHETIFNSNVYVLLEALLLLWFFQTFLFLGQTKKLPLLVASTLVVAWAAEIAVNGSIYRMTVFFKILYSFIVVLMSISIINTILITYKGPVLKNALFLICVGFISFYTLRVLVHAFWLYGLMKSNDFLLNIYYIMLAINFIANVIYATAILLMPKRQPLRAVPVGGH